jgi:sulfur carrier protein
MRVIVNGTQQEIVSPTSVRQLIERAKLSPDKVAVELNRRLLRTAAYDTALKDNDEIEIVTFVGGG